MQIRIASKWFEVFANFIGLGITVLLKWLMLIGFRRTMYRAYYRTNPARANFIGLVLESWNLGLTTQYMIIRGLKLLFAATLFIGRVDTPFLSDDACSIGPFDLDHYPLLFRKVSWNRSLYESITQWSFCPSYSILFSQSCSKDLLAHEAHRHPYLESLGAMWVRPLTRNLVPIEQYL